MSVTSQDVLAIAPVTFTLKSVTSQDLLASAPLTFTHKSPHLSRHAHKCTSDFHSKVSHLARCACKCTNYFHSQVSHLSRRACKCTIDFHSQSLLTSPIREARHCGTVLFSWCSHLALVSLILPLRTTTSVRRTPTVGLISLVVQYLLGYCNTSSKTGSHSTLSYLICGTSSCSNELVLATRCHLNKQTVYYSLSPC